MTGTMAQRLQRVVSDTRRFLRGWWRRWGSIVRRCGTAAVIALVAYLALFPLPRPVTLDVGRFPDRLVIAGFNGDERDNGVTYRWTKTAATIDVPGYGGVRDAHVEVIARNGRGKPEETLYAVSLGRNAVELAAPEGFTPALADVRARGGADLTIRIFAERYIPENSDPRVLGVQVDRVRIEPLAFSWWDGARAGWPWAMRFMLLAVAVALVFPAAWSGLAGGIIAALVAVLAVTVPESRFVLPPLIVPATVVLGGIGITVRWRAAGDMLDVMWNALDQPRIARIIARVLVIAYVVTTLAVIRNVDFIGHADYADNAVRARNIVRGDGDVIDYVPQFYERFARIQHPAETWPPLQVWLIAVVFRIFGTATVLAKLPNVAVMALLIALVAWIGAWRWSRRVGVIAALLLAITPIFFEDTLFPVNDLVFTLLFAAFAVVLYATWVETPDDARFARFRRLGPWMPQIVLGSLAGLLLLAKPSGAALIFGAVVMALILGRRGGRALPWRGIAVALAVAAVWYAPWAIRNIVTFGAPFHSTESYDAWVQKYDPAQPNEGIYRVYWNRDLPHPRLLVGYGYDHFLAVQGKQFARLWGDLTGGAMIPRLLLPFTVLGAIIGASRRPGFGLLLVGAAIPYTLFMLLYWHEELRYFLVFIPWLALYAAAGVEWISDALVTWFAGLWQRALVPIAAAALLLAVVVPAGQDITNRVQAQTGGNEMVQAANWLKENTPADAVVMTRNPWELSWHSERQAVMLPLGSLDEVYAVMRQYHVTVLELDHLNDTSTIRQSLLQLYSFKELPGITRLYDPQNNAYLIFTVALPPA